MPAISGFAQHRCHAAPAYVIDDETAITVVDGAVNVVSEGLWKHFPAVGGG
jgi:hypothetical protein